jgi:hypothetical protein
MFKHSHTHSNFRKFNQFKAFEDWQTSVSVVGKEEQARPTSTSTSTSTSTKPVKPVVAEAKPEVRIFKSNI